MSNNPHQIREFAHTLMTAPPVTEQLRARVDDGLPVAVMWGEFDDAWPIDEQIQMAGDWGAVSRQLDGLGHSPNAERPEELTSAILDFVLPRR